MIKKFILLTILLSISSITVFAISSSFIFDPSSQTFSKNSKKTNVISNFNQDYNLNYSISNTNNELEEEIKILTKKTTYLLFGETNNYNENSENYYKRKKEFYELRYNPEIPKDENNPLGINTKSQEYKDDVISGMAIPQIFNQATELGLIYNSYDNIMITINDNLIISSITLPNVLIKESDKSNQEEYIYKKTNFIMHYYYKKLNNEWKLYYLYGEDTDDINNYFNEIEQKDLKKMTIVPTYQSQLKNIYNFDKINKITNEELNEIYNKNTDNIVFLNAYYNNMVVSSANGFFISKGLIVTTWNFLEKALINAQYISISNDITTFEIEGIVTANPETDIAVIKVKNENNTFASIGDYKLLNNEDPAIVITKKLGTSGIIQTGIIISNENYIETSIPLSKVDEGSPLINSNGEVIGINTSKYVNSSISVSLNSDILNEIQNKFNSLNNDSIKTISFNELKEKYYYLDYNEEQIKNNIPQKQWQKYSKIGDIENKIKLKLVKSSYKDNIVSLRYKNNISNYISSMQLASEFKNKLISDEYKETLNTTTKSIYQNKDYQVIVMDEFDYLIIVMVKL